MSRPEDEVPRPPADLRSVGLGMVAWVSALLGAGPGRWIVLGALLLVVTVCTLRRAWSATALAWTVTGAAVLASAVLHAAVLQESPVRQLAADGVVVTADLQLAADPVVREGRFGESVTVDARVRAVVFQGRRIRLAAPITVRLPSQARGLARGSRVEVRGRLQPAFRDDQAAVLSVRGPVRLITGPGPLTAGANVVRAGIRDAVAGQSAGPRALVPAMVDGDDAGLPSAIVEDFRTTGLTHLLAVSGTNLTLMVGFLLVVARWCGVRARWLILVGGAGVAGFLLLAGPEPSVLRAAAMGGIALIGMGSGGQRRGIRALGVGVVVLMLLDPGLARSPGFALSALATAGILLLAPLWRDALARWLPAWAAEAVAVPLAAQIACTPLVAALSGQVSLVALAANLLAAPLVAPATVLGLLAGLLAVVWGPAGEVVGAPAGWSAAVIIRIAQTGADLPVPAITWASGLVSLAVLTALCVGLALGLRALLARRGLSLVAVCLLVLATTVPLPTPGWPPEGWVMVACSVGQGDGLVLRVSRGAGVVVDAGPDPEPIDRCLKRLGITDVPVLLLTHFHADHIDGLPGVLDGRKVGEILTSPLADPVAGERAVLREAAEAGVPVREATLGESTTLGPLRWEVLAPRLPVAADSESPPNDASVVLLVQTRGIRILMMGDQERPSQAELRRAYPGLRADVLKVAHHGSSKQDAALLGSLGARLAVISVGEGNDYGHPASSALDLLRRAGLQVHRTDQEGDVAVVVRDGGLAVVAHR